MINVGVIYGLSLTVVVVIDIRFHMFHLHRDSIDCYHFGLVREILFILCNQVIHLDIMSLINVSQRTQNLNEIVLILLTIELYYLLGYFVNLVFLVSCRNGCPFVNFSRLDPLYGFGTLAETGSLAIFHKFQDATHVVFL